MSREDTRTEIEKLIAFLVSKGIFTYNEYIKWLDNERNNYSTWDD